MSNTENLQKKLERLVARVESEFAKATAAGVSAGFEKASQTIYSKTERNSSAFSGVGGNPIKGREAQRDLSKRIIVLEHSLKELNAAYSSIVKMTSPASKEATKTAEKIVELKSIVSEMKATIKAVDDSFSAYFKEEERKAAALEKEIKLYSKTAETIKKTVEVDKSAVQKKAAAGVAKGALRELDALSKALEEAKKGRKELEKVFSDTGSIIAASGVEEYTKQILQINQAIADVKAAHSEVVREQKKQATKNQKLQQLQASVKKVATPVYMRGAGSPAHKVASDEIYGKFNTDEELATAGRRYVMQSARGATYGERKRLLGLQRKRTDLNSLRTKLRNEGGDTTDVEKKLQEIDEAQEILQDRKVSIEMAVVELHEKAKTIKRQKKYQRKARVRIKKGLFAAQGVDSRRASSSFYLASLGKLQPEDLLSRDTEIKREVKDRKSGLSEQIKEINKRKTKLETLLESHDEGSKELGKEELDETKSALKQLEERKKKIAEEITSLTRGVEDLISSAKEQVSKKKEEQARQDKAQAIERKLSLADIAIQEVKRYSVKSDAVKTLASFGGTYHQIAANADKVELARSNTVSRYNERIGSFKKVRDSLKKYIVEDPSNLNQEELEQQSRIRDKIKGFSESIRSAELIVKEYSSVIRKSIQIAKDAVKVEEKEKQAKTSLIEKIEKKVEAVLSRKKVIDRSVEAVNESPAQIAERLQRLSGGKIKTASDVTPEYKRKLELEFSAYKRSISEVRSELVSFKKDLKNLHEDLPSQKSNFKTVSAYNDALQETGKGMQARVDTRIQALDAHLSEVQSNLSRAVKGAESAQKISQKKLEKDRELSRVFSEVDALLPTQEGTENAMLSRFQASLGRPVSLLEDKYAKEKEKTKSQVSVLNKAKTRLGTKLEQYKKNERVYMDDGSYIQSQGEKDLEAKIAEVDAAISSLTKNLSKLGDELEREKEIAARAAELSAKTKAERDAISQALMKDTVKDQMDREKEEAGILAAETKAWYQDILAEEEEKKRREKVQGLTDPVAMAELKEKVGVAFDPALLKRKYTSDTELNLHAGEVRKVYGKLSGEVSSKRKELEAGSSLAKGDEIEEFKRQIRELAQLEDRLSISLSEFNEEVKKSRKVLSEKTAEEKKSERLNAKIQNVLKEKGSGIGRLEEALRFVSQADTTKYAVRSMVDNLSPVMGKAELEDISSLVDRTGGNIQKHSRVIGSRLSKIGLLYDKAIEEGNLSDADSLAELHADLSDQQQRLQSINKEMKAEVKRGQSKINTQEKEAEKEAKAREGYYSSLDSLSNNPALERLDQLAQPILSIGKKPWWKRWGYDPITEETNVVGLQNKQSAIQSLLKGIRPYREEAVRTGNVERVEEIDAKSEPLLEELKKIREVLQKEAKKDAKERRKKKTAETRKEQQGSLWQRFMYGHLNFKTANALDKRRSIYKGLWAGGEQTKHTWMRGIMGKGGLRGWGMAGSTLGHQALQQMGLNNLSATLGTFQSNVRQRGIRQAATLGIGRGILGFLGDSYRHAAAVNNSLIDAGNVMGSSAVRAKRYDFQYGYTPQELAAQGKMLATNVGDIGSGMSGLKSMSLASRLGVGQPFAGMLGGLAQTGAFKGSDPKYKKLLTDVISVAIDQGLKRGRWKELMAGFAQLAKSVPLGLKASFESIRNMSLILGHGKGGFKGVRNIQAMKSLDTLIKGRGGGANEAISLLAAGLGSGKGFFKAYGEMEKGLFGGKGGADRAVKFFDTFKSMTGDSGQAKMLRGYLIHQMLGKSITTKGARQLETQVDAYKRGDLSKEGLEKYIKNLTKKNRNIEDVARDGWKNFAAFKTNTMIWQSLQLQIGERIAKYVHAIHNFFQKRVSGSIESVNLLSKKGAYKKLMSGGVTGKAKGFMALLQGVLLGDPSGIRYRLGLKKGKPIPASSGFGRFSSGANDSMRRMYLRNLKEEKKYKPSHWFGNSKVSPSKAKKSFYNAIDSDKKYKKAKELFFQGLMEGGVKAPKTDKELHNGIKKLVGHVDKIVKKMDKPNKKNITVKVTPSKAGQKPHAFSAAK